MRFLLIVLIMAVIASSASAQLRPFQSKAAQQKAAEAKAAREALDAVPGAPVDDLTVNELQLKRKELAGQVVELTFDNVINLKQTGEGYSARVTYESARAAEGLALIIPSDGLEFFEPLADHRGPKREKVYVQVLTSNAAKALGTRYRKNKPEGERYTW